MKSKDLFPIIVLGIVSGVVSIIVSNIVISSDENRSQKVEVVMPIKTTFERPPSEFYNERSVNPTKTIIIGQDRSEQPFGADSEQ